MLAIIKTAAISINLYRPARWIARRVRRGQLRAHRNDIELCRSLLAPGSLCFDVGANIGEKSEALLAAGARVVAFEPNPMVLPELRARCEYHNEWALVPAALGSNPGILPLHAREASGQSSCMEDWEGNIVATFWVPVVTLDSAIEVFGVPAYCKIDVEGWELEVLKGLSRQLPILSFEFHLDEQDIAKTQECLYRLASILTVGGASYANIAPAERAVFHFREWMPLEKFVEWFPGDLDRTLPGAHYGDIFVKNEAAQPA